MPLDKYKKAALDRTTLEFNKWATRILEGIHKKYPNVQVPTKQLMIFYANDLFYKDVINHFCRKYHRRYGI